MSCFLISSLTFYGYTHSAGKMRSIQNTFSSQTMLRLTSKPRSSLSNVTMEQSMITLSFIISLLQTEPLSVSLVHIPLNKMGGLKE